MSLLLRAVLRQLVAERWTTVSVVVGITLAMLSIVAVHLLAEVVKSQLDRATPGSALGFSHMLHRAVLHEDDYFELRARWRAGSIAGVDALVPILEGRVTARRDARLFPMGLPIRIVGLDPLAMSGTSRSAIPSLNGDRAWLTGSAGWVSGGIDVVAGEALGLPHIDEPVVIIGEVEIGSAFDDPVLLVDIGTAQRVLDRPGAITRIGVLRHVEESAWMRAAERLFPGLGARRYVTDTPWKISGYQVEVLQDDGQRLFSAAVLFNLSALSLLSVVVAGFLIHQSAVNSIRQRERIFDRLRALGIDEHWLMVQVVLEGLIVALIGSVLGSVLGWWAAGWLGQLALGGTASALLEDAGGPAFAWAAGKALVFGPLVGCGSMWLAYRSVFGGERKRRSGLLVGGLIFVVGVSLAATGVVGAFLAIAAAAFAAVLLVGPALVFWARAPGGGAATLVGLLNRRNLAHRSADVRVALGGLVIALATAIGMSLMVSNFRVAFEAMLEQRLSADVYLESRIGFSDADLARLRSIVGPDSTIRVERREDGWLRPAGADRRAAGAGHISASFIFDAGDVDALRRYGFPGSLPAGGILLNEPGARRHGITPGDSVEVRGSQGTLELTVVDIFRDYGASSPRVVLASESGAALFGATAPRAVAIAGLNAEHGNALSRYVERSGWRTRSDADVRGLALAIFDRTFRLSDALVVLAVAVAVVGLFNALVAVRLRRAREFRLLHSMGFSVGEFLRLNLWHAGMLGVHAVLVALPLGLVIGWLLCGVLNPRAFGWSIPFGVSAEALLVPAALGLVGALLAGALPGLRTIIRGDYPGA